MDLLIILAEIKFIQSNHGVFKRFAINQSESSITYWEIFICFAINQSDSSFTGHGNFNKFNVSQSEFSSTSHRFFNSFDIKRSSIPSQVIFVVITNQNEVFTGFEDQNQTMLMKLPIKQFF